MAKSCLLSKPGEVVSQVAPLLIHLEEADREGLLQVEETQSGHLLEQSRLHFSRAHSFQKVFPRTRWNLHSTLKLLPTHHTNTLQLPGNDQM